MCNGIDSLGGIRERSSLIAHIRSPPGESVEGRRRKAANGYCKSDRGLSASDRPK